jgi:hypothetical protein
VFKKILAGVSSVSLALGIAALTSVVGPVAAASASTSGPPSAKDGETCVTFTESDKQTFYNGGLTVTKGAISITIGTQYQAGKDWHVSSSGDPLATITINSNGGWQDRTGQTVLNGDYGSDIVGAVICTYKAPTPPPDPTPYVLVAWTMPSWSGDYHTPSWSPYQSFFTKADLATKDLDALDGQLTACGTSYQVDLYNDSATTTTLVSGGKLYGPSNPAEDFPSPSGWGVTYKLVHNADCLPQDAAAGATVSAPTCKADGTGVATFTLTFADWSDTTGPEDQTVGDHTRTANAQSGHLFSNGQATMDVSYTIPPALDATSADCYHPVPVKPSYSSIRGCGVYGSITLVDTQYVTYAITSGDGTQGWNIVTATPVSPYTFADGTKTSWAIDLGHYRDCYHPKVSGSLDKTCVWNTDTSTSGELLTVSFDNSGSTVDVLFTIPDYSISDLVAAGDSDQVTITIGTAGSGWIKVYADGHLLKKLHKVKSFDGCEPVTVTADPGSTATCNPNGSVADGAVNVDWMPAKITYTIVGELGSGVNQLATGPATALPPGHYTVTATALPGYVLGGQTSWDETIDDPSPCVVPCDQQLGLLSVQSVAIDCDPPTLDTWQTAADPKQPTCQGQNGSLTVGDVGGGVSFFTGKVDYFLDGSVTPMVTQTVALAPGTHTVTAAPHVLGDGLTGPTSFSIDIVASTVTCGDLKTLALTGTSPSGAFGLAYGLLAAGLALVAMRLVRRRRGEQN